MSNRNLLVTRGGLDCVGGGVGNAHGKVGGEEQGGEGEVKGMVVGGRAEVLLK